MKKLHYEIEIAAPRERVWGNIITVEPYREWTEPFMPGSYFEGSWEKGSNIRFLAKNQNGVPEGMFSEVAENKPYEFISLRHLGIIKDGVVDTESEEAKKWTTYENYTLKNTGDKTVFAVDMAVEDVYEPMFSESWPKALRKLKEISEE